MISERFVRPRKKLFYLLWGLLGLQLYLALLVIIGWYLGSVTLTQVLPQFAPMQFNTALGFVFSALGLVGLLQERPHWLLIFGALLVLLSGLTLIQYLFGVNIGLDQLFVEVESQVRTTHPGRPSPNTAFCFLVTGLLFCSEVLSDRLNLWPQRYWLTGVFLCAVAILTFLGYLIEVPTHYGWSHLVRMAVHTSFGFLLTGLVLLGFVWLRGGMLGLERRQMMTVLVATLGFIVALMNYQIIVFVQEKNIRDHRYFLMGVVANQLVDHIQSRVSAFERLVDRSLQETSPIGRDQDIRDYLRDMPDLFSVGLMDQTDPEVYQRLAGNNRVPLPEKSTLAQLNAQLENTIRSTVLDWQGPYLWVAVRRALKDQTMIFQLDLEQKLVSLQQHSGLVGSDSQLVISASDRELQDHLQALNGMVPLQITREVNLDGFVLKLSYLDEPRWLIKNNKPIITVFVLGILMAISLAMAVNWFLRNKDLQNYLQDIQNASTTGLIGSDFNGRIIFCNESARNMFGYSEAELRSMSIEDLLPPDMRGYHVNLRAGLQDQRISRKLESRRLSGYDSKGETFPLDIGIGFTETDQGVMVISSLVDMRPQRKLEADLSSRNTELSLLLNSVGEGIYGVDARGMCTFVNPAACKMLGYGESQLLNSFIHDLIHYKNLQGGKDEWHQSVLHRVLTNTETLQVQDEMYWRRDGSTFFVDFVASPISVEGKVLGAVVVFSDITVRRELEQLQHQHTEKLKQVNQELEEFNYVASHDLKEPLRTLKNFCAFLEEDLDGNMSDDVKRDLHFINQATDRMQMLINDLLEYSRAGSQAMTFAEVDLNSMMIRIQENLQAAVEDSGASFLISELPSVLGDTQQLERVFQNLISNAIKFHGDQPPRIVISADSGKESGHVVVAVEDNGQGIAEGYQEQIFGAFKRLHTLDEVEGTGIGLAVVKKLVERHNGRVWLHSKEGEGSIFFVELPAYQA